MLLLQKQFFWRIILEENSPRANVVMVIQVHEKRRIIIRW